MNPGHSWREVALCREIFGTFQSLAMRPLSRGHETAIIEAQQRLRSLTSDLDGGPGAVLNLDQRSLLASFVKQLGVLPTEVIARTFLESLREALKRVGRDTEDLACSYVTNPPDVGLRRLVVTAGPTIGLGDEVLVARALIERARLCGVTLEIATRNYELWSCLRGPTTHLGNPPLAGLDRLAELTDPDGTACLFFDFLESDPVSAPYVGPQDAVRYAGRWKMGSEAGDFVDCSRAMRYRLRYPEGLPANRFLESRWAAARAVPGPVREHRSNLWLARLPREDLRIAVQLVTTKPQLTLSSTFYRDVFARSLLSSGPGRVTAVFIPPPSESGQRFAAETARAVQRAVPQLRIEMPPPTSLGGVHKLLANCDVLFGPDTFTAHLAADLGLPQVTISLAAHRSWLTLGAPCLGVAAEPYEANVAVRAARQLSAMVSVVAARALESSAGKAAREALREADGWALRHVYDGYCPPRDDMKRWTEEMNRLLSSHERVCNELLGESPVSRRVFAPERYDSDVDGMRAFVRFYHTIALDPVTALLAAA